MKKIRSVLNKTELAGGVLFPLFTLFLILRDDPLTTNLSWVGNGLDYRLLLVIWAIVGALVFRAMIRALAEALGVSLQRRRAYLIQELGIGLSEDVLPMCGTVAYLRPYLLNKTMALAVGPEAEPCV